MDDSGGMKKEWKNSLCVCVERCGRANGMEEKESYRRGARGGEREREARIGRAL